MASLERDLVLACGARANAFLLAARQAFLAPAAAEKAHSLGCDLE
jgi:hypothetical protein